LRVYYILYYVYKYTLHIYYDNLSIFKNLLLTCTPFLIVNVFIRIYNKMRHFICSLFFLSYCERSWITDCTLYTRLTQPRKFKEKTFRDPTEKYVEDCNNVIRLFFFYTPHATNPSDQISFLVFVADS